MEKPLNPRVKITPGGRAYVDTEDLVNSVLIERKVESYLNSIPADEALSIMGHGTYTADELRDHFRRKTAVGERLTVMVLDGEGASKNDD